MQVTVRKCLNYRQMPPLVELYIFELTKPSKNSRMEEDSDCFIRDHETVTPRLHLHFLSPQKQVPCQRLVEESL